MELHERRGDPIPEGWGCDAQGKLTTDPKRVLSGGGLVPIGGSEATGQKPADSADKRIIRAFKFLFHFVSMSLKHNIEVRLLCQIGTQFRDSCAQILLSTI